MDFHPKVLQRAIFQGWVYSYLQWNLYNCLCLCIYVCIVWVSRCFNTGSNQDLHVSIVLWIITDTFKLVYDGQAWADSNNIDMIKMYSHSSNNMSMTTNVCIIFKSQQILMLLILKCVDNKLISVKLRTE